MQGFYFRPFCCLFYFTIKHYSFLRTIFWKKNQNLESYTPIKINFPSLYDIFTISRSWPFFYWADVFVGVQFKTLERFIRKILGAKIKLIFDVGSFHLISRSMKDMSASSRSIWKKDLRKCKYRYSSPESEELRDRKKKKW